MDRNIADFSGTWKMKTSENFEELLKALGVNVFIRKIAVAAASRPAVEITQQGESLSIQTSTSVRTTHVSFTVGQSFNETTVDGRLCTVILHFHTLHHLHLHICCMKYFCYHMCIFCQDYEIILPVYEIRGLYKHVEIICV
ncbi:cellular retinoic acid-binding protein 2b [Oncorhynchus keta]|uniref:cellular retinoic acid-binding protein 2b n=1 Tax=Oncorhynchus keta TaxID=8018 RepID=UPI00227C0FD5|nr:cellular retinoic acid-binding protein 2b [Oncorhynchus keta]XP_052326583.1 cellular retinoic acid-binding protein 2b [Oncorhynchus keta]